MNTLLKRLLDLLAGGAALLVLSPLLLGIAAAIRISDGNPVLFRQLRVGLGGRPFTIYKFRTMRQGPPNARPTDYTEGADWSQGVPDDFMFKSGRSPNVTALGNLLRRYSLDELPQFLNVLQGTMSLVGPRPEIPGVADYYNAEQRQRLKVKPGITGLAQIRGRSDISHGDKIRYDLEYVRSWSFLLDVNILLRTALLAVTGKGSI